MLLSASTRPPSARSTVLQTALVGVLYFLGAKLGLSLAVAHGNATAIWPPTGIALAALLILGRRVWPGIFLGAFAANVTTPIPMWTALVIGAGNTLGPLLSASLLKMARFRNAMDRPRDVVLLGVLGAAIGPSISASIGVSSLAMAGEFPFASFLFHLTVWWMGDAMGILLLAPLPLTLTSCRHGISRRRCLEALGVVALMSSVGSLAFFDDRAISSFAIFPLFVWAAVRFQQRGVAVSVVASTAVGVWAILSGNEPFGGADATEGVQVLQGFMSMVAISNFVLAATISERDRYHTELRLDRDKLRDAQRLGGVGSLEWEFATNRLTLSPEIYAIHGLDEGGAVDLDTLFSTMDDATRGKFEDNVGRALALGRETTLPEIEHTIRRPDGSQRTLLTRGRILYADGAPARMLGTVQDLTEIRAKEDALAKSEAQFRLLIEGIEDYAIYLLDAGGNILTWNPGAERITGYTREEAVGRHFSMFYPEEERAKGRPEQQMSDAAQSGRKDEEGWRVKKDGSRFWAGATISAIRSESGELHGFAKVTRNLTARKVEEDTLRMALKREREAGKRLRELDEMKNAFLQAISHDLRTPLTVIIGFARTLRDHSERVDTPSSRDMLSRIVSNAERLESMLLDLLDLERLSRGILDPKRSSIDVSHVVCKVIESVDLKGRPIEFDPTPAIGSVDRAQVERIVENLLANAVKHTPSGTRIWVRVRSIQGVVEIAVEDEGSGVPESIRYAIFEPFRQGNGTHSSGSGIGLSLVKRFAELHGGRAWVETRPGGGSSFRVILPQPTLATQKMLDSEVDENKSLTRTS